MLLSSFLCLQQYADRQGETMKSNSRIPLMFIILSLSAAVFFSFDGTSADAAPNTTVQMPAKVSEYIPADSYAGKTYTVQSEKLVALTFDDGPYSPVTDRILDVLEENGAVATFFVVGNRVPSYISSVRRAHSIGCEIGSHTYSHKNLSRLSRKEIRYEVSESEKAIFEAIGEKPALLRPPEGGTNKTVQSAVDYPLIMWNVDTDDWCVRDKEKDCIAVFGNVSDGSIILMHDLYPETAQAVEDIVPKLKTEGYKFVTVSELMKLRGIKLENGKKYFRAINKATD